MDSNADLRNRLETLDPLARDDLRRVLIHDQADRDAVSSQLLRYRDGHGDDWADIIDMLTMHPEARRRVARLLGEIEASSPGDTLGDIPPVLGRSCVVPYIRTPCHDLRIRTQRDGPEWVRTSRIALPRWGSRVRIPSSAPGARRFQPDPSRYRMTLQIQGTPGRGTKTP